MELVLDDVDDEVDDEEDDDEDAFEELDDLLDVAGSLVSVIFAANGKNNFNISYLDTYFETHVSLPVSG